MPGAAAVMEIDVNYKCLFMKPLTVTCEGILQKKMVFGFFLIIHFGIIYSPKVTTAPKRALGGSIRAEVSFLCGRGRPSCDPGIILSFKSNGWHFGTTKKNFFYIRR